MSSPGFRTSVGTPINLVMALAVLAAPLASAGSEERPEVSDPEGDQGGVDEVTRYADILAAWIHNETDDSFDVTLKLQRLESPFNGTYTVAWTTNAVVDGYQNLGVRARAPATGPATFHLLHASSEDAWTEEPLAGTVTRGAPGYLRWTVPKVSVRLVDGQAFGSFQAYVNTADVGGLAGRLDSAEAVSVYVTGGRTVDAFDAFVPPDRDPDVDDGANDPPGLAPFADVLGVWLDFGEQLNLTLRLQEVNVESWRACDRDAGVKVLEAQFNLRNTISGPENRLQLLGRILWAPPSFAVLVTGGVTGSTLNGTVAVVEGQPGWVRFSVPGSLWETQTDIEFITIDGTVVTQCGSDGQSGTDSVAHRAPDEVPLPRWAPWAALVVASAWLRRRKL